MSGIVIRVENLTKEYRLGVINHGTLRQDLQSWWARIRGKEDPNSLIASKASAIPSESVATCDNPHMLALNDISLDVNEGEILGIIGRNGAGKSTLLKILSRVTAPTKGTVRIKGRIASLLEVGTGFHPELTGRENVYLNGAIMGMTREEVKNKFDEIVDFSGVEKFIDTPVKRYSSGMYVRLAFAVAAHLEPEILIIDEVLAVGDAEFQKKCLGKISKVAKKGRTILFVSHNMATLQSLCSRAILLQNGRKDFSGNIEDTINRYLHSVQLNVNEQSLHLRENRTGGNKFRFQKVEFIAAERMESLKMLISGQSVLIRIHYRNNTGNELNGIALSIGFYVMAGNFLFACRSDAIGKMFNFPPGEGVVICNVPKWPLSRGRYMYNLMADMRGETLDWVTEAGAVDVESGDYYGSGKLPASAHQGVFVDFGWKEGAD